jgi:hypothetical protein
MSGRDESVTWICHQHFRNDVIFEGSLPDPVKDTKVLWVFWVEEVFEKLLPKINFIRMFHEKIRPLAAKEREVSVLEISDGFHFFYLKALGEMAD